MNSLRHERRFIVRPCAESDTNELGEVFRKSVREVASRDYRPAQIEAWVKAPGEIEAWTERMRGGASFSSPRKPGI